MSRRILKNIYGRRVGDDVYCAECPAPQNAKDLKLVRVGSVCLGCGVVYSGRGVWVPSGKTLITAAKNHSVEDLAEKFLNIHEKVRKVEIDQVPKASLYDLLQYELEAKNPHEAWNKLSTQFEEVLPFGENFRIFPGQGQKPTPVVSLKEWLHILMLVKKPIGTEVRQVASEALEVKLNEIMGVVKSQGRGFQETLEVLTSVISQQLDRLVALETRLKSPVHNSVQLTEAHIMSAIRELFESQWKITFQDAGLIDNDDDWEKFNKEWKRANCGANRKNWKLRHYVAAVSYIRAKYNIDLWPSVLGPFVKKVNTLRPARPTITKGVETAALALTAGGHCG